MSWLLLCGEAFTVLKASGIVMIAAGVALVELGAQRARRAGEAAGELPAGVSREVVSERQEESA